ncbi:hypothetical protein ABZT26_25705 [Streptomyces sp. NPDC005395]|uniref:hypothetical protein n=1 Tax=Streptomyces sp. NPDC005395 TaxID=3157042 RepID=UPI0033B3A43F
MQSPLKLVGTGSPIVNPWKLSLEVNGKTGCAAVAACVANSLGPGLTYDAATGKIQVRLSRDAGQVARFGGDAGLLVTDGSGGSPATCVRGIKSLPPAPFTMGALDLAGLVGPYSSPYQVEYCLAHKMDIIHFRATTSSDDVGVASDYADHRIHPGRTSAYITQDIRQMSASTVQSVWNYAGDRDDPEAFTWGDGITAAQRKDRRGGWYGWLAQGYYQPLVSDHLRKIAGKAVAFLECVPEEGASYPEASAIIGPIRDVLEHCAQDWAMIGVAEIANARTVINNGITPIMVSPDQIPMGVTDLPWTVAELKTAGIEWIVLSERYADSVFTTYRTAGFQILMRGISRQWQHSRVTALGIRGALNLDPVYARGPVSAIAPEFGGRGYRSETDPWEHRRPGTGLLSHRTDRRAVLSYAGLIRGHTLASEQGLVLPAGFGELGTPGRGIGRPCVLIGWECPMTNPDSYTITWEMKWNTLAANSPVAAKMGVLFGAATDAEPFDWPDDPAMNDLGFPPGQRTMYRAYQRQSGEIGIGKWTAQSPSIQILASQSTPAIAAGVYNKYSLTVTPTTISLTRTLSNGFATTISATDNQYRGPYFWLEKEETYISDVNTQNRFEGMARSFTYTAGA